MISWSLLYFWPYILHPSLLAASQLQIHECARYAVTGFLYLLFLCQEFFFPRYTWGSPHCLQNFAQISPFSTILSITYKNQLPTHFMTYFLPCFLFLFLSFSLKHSSASDITCMVEYITVHLHLGSLTVKQNQWINAPASCYFKETIPVDNVDASEEVPAEAMQSPIAWSSQRCRALSY